MTNRLNISLTYLPLINFAMQQNHVPVIREISLQNPGDEVIENIEIRVRFEPDFAQEFTAHIDSISPHSEEKLTAVPVSISTVFLANLTERVSGRIMLTAQSGADIIWDSSHDISVLTFNEWGGSNVMPEMLAAFSTPNHPALNRIIRRSSEILDGWTGKPDLNGYQDRDPNRVKYQMAAVFEAIAELGVTYCVNPASFEKEGQRIRTADEILSGGLGNCLDMTMLYVSCLECIGLHPLIIMTDDRAYAGCWLIQDSFADSVNDDPSLLSKRIAAGINEILLVECTASNKGCTASFDSACMSAAQTLQAEHFSFFIDVCRARASQIRPLPLRVTDDTGQSVIDEGEIYRDASAPLEMSVNDLIIDSKEDVNKKTIWERKLLDLSLRNNLLNLRLTRSTIPFMSSDISAFEDALADNEDFRICPKPSDWESTLLNDGLYKTINATDPIHALIEQELKQNRIRTYLEEDDLRKSLTHLYRSAKTSMEENGANTLYLALGLLKWFETPTSQKPRYAPILLVPVEIVRKSAASGYVLRSRDEDTMLNITLLELLRQMFGITIGGLDPLPKDESGIDTSLVFNTIRRKIMEQKNWDVVEQAILGNFSFSKFIMWNDIHNNSDVLCQSPIVSSLMEGVVDERINADIDEDDDLDEKLKTEDIILPISADSSQIEAITAALSEKSFILHGPPGTGKSQTITNIIANALYRGKKVLFVAEKMAALEVVQNRLNAIGLGPFCLELHSNKAKKSNVLEQLKKTTEVVKTKSPDDYRIEAEKINGVRKDMNAILKALHKPYPAGLSLYDCISRYVCIDENCPAFDIPVSKVGCITGEMLGKMETALSELSAAISIIGNPGTNPLHGISCLEYDAEVEQTLASLTDIIDIIDTLNKDLSVLHRRILSSSSVNISKKDYDFLIGLSQELDNDDIFIDIHTESDDSINAISGIIGHGRKRDLLKRDIERDYGDDILEIDVKAFEKEWRDILSKGFIIRLFSTRKYLRKLGTYCSKPVEAENVLNLLKKVHTYQSEDHTVNEVSENNGFLTSHICGYGTEWDKIEKSCDYVKKVRKVIYSYASDPQKRKEISDHIASFLAHEDRSIFRNILEKRDEMRSRLAMTLSKLNVKMAPSEDDFMVSTRDILSRWHSGRDKIRSWILYNKCKEAVSALGFPEMAEQINSGAFDRSIIKTAFYKAIYKSYAEYILTLEQDLQLFHGTMFEEKIRRFRDLCKDFEELTKEEMFAKVASGLPALQKEASHSSEVGILQRNIRNGCRGISLRSFFSSIPNLLHRMCPCMLMSPISVAQYIKADGMKFDLVIFDEASQMPTCEAVGAIARGKEIIVVGDPKQLPPTTFFTSNTYDEDNPQFEDLESILDDCLALSLPSKYLRWHYRSRHESLIAFSNSKYYDSQLYTFPSPDDLTTKVGYQHVNGTYDRGGSRQNRNEAEAIIKEIEQRLEDPVLSKMSIGVVTFNTNQQSLLEDLLNDLFIRRPDLEKKAVECNEPIFIKNLENVQGDERDVILFSIGYGQDKNGKVTLNFGPLNREGGWRRLNVAVSRARYEMKIFSTLRSDQIDLKRTSAAGVAGLKEFLEYAEKGMLNGMSQAQSAVSHDGFVEAVAGHLRAKGHEVRTNIGTSGYRIDIGVVNPKDGYTYVLGILCDGYNYAASRSARDREIIQISVLDSLGWKICRVWCLDWWLDKEAVLDSICRNIEDAIAGCPAEAGQADDMQCMNCSAVPAPIAISSEPDPVHESIPAMTAQDDGIEYLIPYTFTDLEPRPLASEDVVNGYHDEIIRNYIRQVIETEAPIIHDLLCRRVLRAINIARMGVRVSSRMQTIINSMNLKKTEETDPVYWKDSQDPDTYSLVRYSNAREAMHIPIVEAKNAALYVLDQQGAMPFESLIREMTKVFGYGRAGDNVYMVMMSGINLGIALSLIDKSDPERISLA